MPGGHSSATHFEVSPEIDRSLFLTPMKFGDTVFDLFDPAQALATAVNQAIDIATLADEAAAALLPVNKEVLINRLTVLGLSMAGARDPQYVNAWLHETARHLVDLPASVVFLAIDRCVRQPGRIYLPSVGEIMAEVEAPLHQLRIQATRLRRLADLLIYEDVCQE